ncbi:VOC family protein [Kangiella sp.]|uniref:VOC family protein n=1 Tax=Kangiella sp. TaxID=1920245 RepID=UPI003A94BC6F
MKPVFKPGRNMAMKVPAHEYDQTVAFYRDVLGFELIPLDNDEDSNTIRFKFGDKVLWIDRVTTVSQTEIWLEVTTDDMDGAAEYLQANEVVRCDEIEPLPDGFEGFWISSPANIIHLVTNSD